MKLLINGEEMAFSDTSNLQDILDILQIESKIMAVALNSKLVRKESYQSTIPNNGDRIEFLQFMGGG